MTKGKQRKGLSRAVVDLKHTAYEENKEAIIADPLSMGRAATWKKWKIPRGTIGQLIRRWLTPEQQKIMANAAQEPTMAPADPKTPVNGRLPPYPYFMNSWDIAVQVKWLEVYGMLATEVHKEGQ